MADSAEPQASPRSEEPGLRYSAFISYNSRDAPFVRRLHKRLETYRVPGRLTGTSPTVEGKTHRIKPIFRDNVELSAAYDLTTVVREAIAQSDYLIVVCSPHSAKSKWVGREIELFRTLHGDSRILAALIDGTPQTAFPPALHGRLPADAFEPLAADFRPGASGHKLAFLKLVAALIGVRLDELLQRDSQRQIRRITAVAVGSVAGIATVAVLGLLALNARAEAESQRLRAGGLGAFMLRDLRKGLKQAGRTDLQTEVSKAALSYYRGQDLSRLPPDDLVQRAAALQAMGEDNEKRGDLAAAQEEFEEAHRTTAALLAAKPDDPKRIFAHAQSEYWVGFINWRNGNGAAAKTGLEAYARSAQRLIQINPKNPDWQHEVAYAELNLGTLAMRQDGDAVMAERHFEAALARLRLIAALRPRDVDLQIEVSDAYAWLADSRRLQGDFDGAAESRLTERKILDDLAKADPRNVEVQGDLLGNELGLARIDAARGAWRPAIARLDKGLEAARQVELWDPDNKNIPKRARMLELFKVRTLLNAPKAARPPAARLEALLGECRPAQSAKPDEISDFCTVLQARLLAEQGDRRGAQRLLEPLEPRIRGKAAYSERWTLSFAEEARAVQTSSEMGRPKPSANERRQGTP